MQEKRIESLSYLRVFATFAIILLHTLFTASSIYGSEIGFSNNLILIILVNCSMWAVPLFLMVTGSLLLQRNKKITFAKVFKTYVFRILLALTIFAFIYNIFDVITNKENFSISIIINTIWKIYSGNSWNTLWYLYMLIGIYILLPFYKKIINYSNAQELRYLLVVYIVFLSILPFLGTAGFASGFYVDFLTIYPFYLLLGYVIYTGIIKLNVIVSVIPGIVGTALISVLTYIRYTNEILYLDALWSYSSLLVIMQAVSIFSLTFHLKREYANDETIVVKKNRSQYSLIYKLIKELDSCSFGIYLIHIIFVKLFFVNLQINPFIGNPIFNFFSLIIGNLFLSYIITKVCKYIPLLNKVL